MLTNTLIFILNWVLKLLMAWLMYSISMMFQSPEWMTIALVAIGVSGSDISYKRG